MCPMSDGPARLDATAKRIIELLQEDGRISYAAIAKAVGLSEAADAYRIFEAREDGVLKVLLDPTG